MTFILGDCRQVLAKLEPLNADMCLTSPPFWCQRDYGHDSQIGLEFRLQDYVDELVFVFRLVRKHLKPGGALWLNLGDTYHGAGYSNNRINSPKTNGDRRRSRQQDLIRHNPQLKPKDLAGVPWTVALALRADGWWIRSEVIWRKTRRLPDTAKDRPAKSHEHLFLLVNGRHSAFWGGSDPDVWDLSTSSNKSHFATFPEDLARRCIHASCPPFGLVCDPFAGSLTVGRVAESMGRNFVGIDINEPASEVA